MMSSSETLALRTRTLRAFLLLAGQRAVTLVVTAAGGILLARFLTPEEFGLYAIIAFVVGVGVILGDLGLGAALVQRKQLDPALTLGAAFTLQAALAFSLGAALVGLAPIIVQAFRLPPEAVGPLRWLALLVPLSAFRMPAAVLLERGLAYLPLSLADTLDPVVFHAAAVAAALAGAGVWSFVLGAVTARLTTLAVLWAAAGWRPVLRWSWTDAAPVLGFGILYQGSTLVSLIRDAALPTFVVAWSGVASVGLLNWGATIAFLPLQLVSIAGRVLFPALSRLQDAPLEFAAATERAMNRVAALLYPVALLLLAGADVIVRPIYGDAWVPAVPAVRLFCVAAVLGGTTNLLLQVLYSLGRADIVLRLNLLWAALVWAFTLLFVPRVGFVGFALASACASATGIPTALALRRLVPVRIFHPVRVPLLAGLASALLMSRLAASWIHDLFSLLIAVCTAAVAYIGLACLLGGATWRAELLADWRRIRQPSPAETQGMREGRTTTG
jgi:PST family polysaccharide transporter